jgi:hypothetical protein
LTGRAHQGKLCTRKPHRNRKRNKIMNETFIVITGNPVDGFTYHGPFVSAEDANAYAEDLPTDWWVAPLQS